MSPVSKYSLWEESTRVPLIIVCPNRYKASRSDLPVGLIDIYPTLVELCGLPAKSSNEGVSFVPLMSQSQPEWRHAIPTTYARGSIDTFDTKTAAKNYTVTRPIPMNGQILLLHVSIRRLLRSFAGNCRNGMRNTTPRQKRDPQRLVPATSGRKWHRKLTTSLQCLRG
jgi:hypothetical protein